MLAGDGPDVSCATRVKSDKGTMMPRSFSREELYNLVWSKPMTHLAKEFALSDVALHKICRKHGIPTPPLGWWARKAAGKAVAQTPLPKAAAGAADKITIAGANLSREGPVTRRRPREGPHPGL